MKYGWGSLSTFAHNQNIKAIAQLEHKKPIIDLIHKELVDNDTEFYYETIEIPTGTIEARTIDSNITILRITSLMGTMFVPIRSYAVHKHFLFTTEDNHCGSEDLTLWVYNLHVGTRSLVEEHVGPSLAATETCLYYTRAKKRLIYKHVISLEFLTGNKKLVYSESDERFNLSVFNINSEIAGIQCENTRLTSESIKIGNKLHTTGRKHGINYKWVSSEVFLTNRDSPHYGLYTETSTLWNATEETGSIIDAKPFMNGWIVLTVKQGQTALFYIGSTSIQILKSSFATIQLMSKGRFLYRSPSYPDSLCEYTGDRINVLRQDAAKPKLTIDSHYAISSDGTRVPYILVKKTSEIKGLVVVGYGSYGIMLNLSYPKRWLPLIERGYGIVYAFVRGGWENGQSWYRGGSLRNRGHCRQDFSACITSAQRIYHISPANTTLYGRSAGGFLVASTANRFPHIADRIYIEAPFLDVLHTMSNRELPLTQLEYDEFGNPKKRESDEHILAGLSPTDNIKGFTFPKHVIIRSATHDSQVYSYESDKWVAQIQKVHPRTNIFYHVDECEGHFVSHTKQLRNMAEDITLILS